MQTHPKHDRFSRHMPGATALATIEKLKRAFRELDAVLAQIPDCRDKSLAITALEDSSMRACRAAVVTDTTSVPID